MMKNKFNEIFSNHFKMLKLGHNTLFYFVDEDGIEYVFNAHKKYYPIIKEILDKFYDFETEIKPVIIEEIKRKKHYGKFYFPLPHDLTEEEKFYIILKYGEDGEYLLKERY